MIHLRNGELFDIKEETFIRKAWCCPEKWSIYEPVVKTVNEKPKEKFIKLKVIGMTTLIYSTKVPYGSDGKYEWKEEYREGTVLYAKNKKQIYEIVLKKEEGLDYDHWYKASRGVFEIKKIDSIINKSMLRKPKKGKKKIVLPLDEIDFNSPNTIKHIKNDLFSIYYDDGDKYQPCGFYKINYDNFK
jgi:hypothetical protein